MGLALIDIYAKPYAVNITRYVIAIGKTGIKILDEG
jgi:hypothetical protein